MELKRYEGWSEETELDRGVREEPLRGVASEWDWLKDKVLLYSNEKKGLFYRVVAMQVSILLMSKSEGTDVFKTAEPYS